MARNLITVIDEIIAIAPDLEPCFKSLKTSTAYTAPEMMTGRWSEAAAILNINARDHPEKEKISEIFGGPKS